MMPTRGLRAGMAGAALPVDATPPATTHNQVNRMMITTSSGYTLGSARRYQGLTKERLRTGITVVQRLSVYKKRTRRVNPWPMMMPTRGLRLAMTGAAPPVDTTPPITGHVCKVITRRVTSSQVDLHLNGLTRATK